MTGFEYFRDLHYTNHKWKMRTEFKMGVDSIDHMPLVPPSKVILPPLHIKLGMMRNFIVKLNEDAIKDMKNIFPKLSDSKIKAGKQA